MGGNSNALNARYIVKYTQLNIQTSAQDIPIPLAWGKVRIGNNLIWYGDFTATQEGGKKGGGGGKGGPSKGSGVYDYTASVILAICEGPITTIGTVWQNNLLTTLGDAGLTFFSGTASQAPWSFMTSNHPTQAVAYAYTCYVAEANMFLGHSPDISNFQFEVVTPLSGSMPGTVDVNMADVIDDLLTNPQYSIALPSGAINTSDLAFYKTYTTAAGLFFSPTIQEQEQAASVIDRWAQITNSWIFWSGTQLRFVPLGDTAITANGVTYTPITAVRYSFTYDDYKAESGEIPVTVDLGDPADFPNHLRLEILDRNNQYDAAVSPWFDQGLIDQYGRIDSSISEAHEICDTGVGQIVAQLVGQRGAYVRNQYKFKLGAEFGTFLEPGDIVQLTEPHILLTNYPVRVKTLDEDEKGDWSIVAEELPARIGTAEGTQQAQAVTNSTPDLNVSPGNSNPPSIFEPSSALARGVPQVWITASGGANWGGALVYISFDSGSTYNPIGQITSPAAQGTLTATLPSNSDPDTTDTLAIDTTISQVILPTDATHADADAFRTLCIITDAYTSVVPNNGELLAYGSSAAGLGTYDSNLTYLRRGLYGSTIASHASGSFFTRINLNATQPPINTTLIYDLPAAYIGQTIFIKLVSFNRFGNAFQDISSVPAYSYTPSGAGFGGGPGGVPTIPTGLVATAGYSQNALTWNLNPSTDNVNFYDVYAASGLSQPFSSATLIGSTASPLFTHTGLTAGSQWTYFLKAHNDAGLSSATSGVNCTTLATPVNALRFYGSLAGKPTASQTLFENDMVGGETLPISLVGSVGGCDVAPTGNITCSITKNGSSIGTMNIASGATTATFTFGSAVTFSSGDVLGFFAPSSIDATLSGLRYTFIGTR